MTMLVYGPSIGMTDIGTALVRANELTFAKVIKDCVRDGESESYTRIEIANLLNEVAYARSEDSSGVYPGAVSALIGWGYGDYVGDTDRMWDDDPLEYMSESDKERDAVVLVSANYARFKNGDAGASERETPSRPSKRPPTAVERARAAKRSSCTKPRSKAKTKTTAKPKSTAGKSTASKQRKPAQPRKANGQFAKKPKSKGGRR